MFHYRSNEECNIDYLDLQSEHNLRTNNLPKLLINSQFCAVNFLDPSNKRTCPGDSGGPVIKQHSIGRKIPLFTIIGIISGGFGGSNCDKNEEVPDYFTYVEHEEVDKIMYKI